MAALFTVVMLASIGLPGLSGFVSEYLILIGTFATHAWWGVVGAFGVVAAAVYLLWGYQRVFHGRATGENATMTDATTKERWVIAPVIALIVVLGVFPHPLLDASRRRCSNSSSTSLRAGWTSDRVQRRNTVDPLPGDTAGRHPLRGALALLSRRRWRAPR